MINKITHLIQHGRRWLWLPPILIGIVVFGLIISRRKPLPKRPDAELQAELHLSVTRIRAEPLALTATGYGTAQPVRRWQAVAEVSGRVVEIAAEGLTAGTWLDSQALLLRIDPEDYLLRIQQRQADVDAANARLQELSASAEADQKTLKIEQQILDVQRADIKRVEQLLQQNAVSENELDLARTNLLQQERAVQSRKNSLSLYDSQIASAEANLATAKSRLAEAQRDHARTTIRVPFAGRITHSDLEVGQFVNTGQTLLAIEDAGTVEINAQFGINELNRLLSLGQPPGPDIPTARNPQRSANGMGHAPAESADQVELAGLHADVVVQSGGQRWTYVGQVIRAAESVDPATRTLGVTVRVANDHRNSDGPGLRNLPLLPGEYCQVLLKGPTRSVISIPRHAIDDQVVYVLDSDNCLQPQPVVLGAIQDDRQVVIAGLSPGQRLVLQAPLPAIGGQKVVPVEGPPEQNAPAAGLSPTPAAATPFGPENRDGEQR